jgi:hypothetical protein
MEQITTALISAGFGFVGGLAGAATNYFISQRQLSRSGARLLANLQILEKARALQLDPTLTAAIEEYVRGQVEWHTHKKERLDKNAA